MIFRYDFVAGGEIVPQKCLVDRIEKDGWDGRQGQKFVRDTSLKVHCHMIWHWLIELRFFLIPRLIHPALALPT
jgi:hypothetical protein